MSQKIQNPVVQISNPNATVSAQNMTNRETPTVTVTPTLVAM